MKSERQERLKDLLLAAVLLMIGIGGFVFINPTGADITDGPGGLSWRTLPFLYSGVLIVLVVLFAASAVYDLWLIGQGRAPRSVFGDRPPVEVNPVADTRRVITLACLFTYAAGIRMFGFAIAAPILLFVMLRVLGRRNLVENLAVSLIGALALWLLFVGILKLPLSGQTWDPLTPLLNQLYALTGAR
jgi:hypothetical protein